MGVKLMTGATGEQNIQAADDRECLAGITGLDSYVFPTGSQLKATLVDANTVTIGTGAGSLQGSRFRCSTTTTVNIQSGTQGQYRHDIVGLHFSRETSGREGLEFQVLTGEPAASEGAAADPAYTAGDLLKGDAEAFMPLYRVKLSGINAADPEPMFSVLTPLATIGDSVSQTIDVIESQAFSDIEVSAQMRSGIVCVNIYRAKNDSVQALTKNNAPSAIGKIKREYWPSRNYVQYIGTKNGAWLLMSVNKKGEVAIYHQYDPSDLYWSYFEGSLSYPIA